MCHKGLGLRKQGEKRRRPDSDLEVAVEIQWHESLQLEDETTGWSKPLAKKRFNCWKSDDEVALVLKTIERSLQDALPVELDLNAFFGPVETPTVDNGLSEGSRLVYSDQ